jgi:hypothetical protein
MTQVTLKVDSRRSAIDDSLISTGTFWLLALVFGAAAIYVHSAASLTLPIPWGDEAYFVWQARALERWNTFIAPELDATRPMLLLPFVYQGTLGVLFKIVGFSLETARHVSLVFVLAGFAFLAAMARSLAIPIAALAFLGPFMLNGHFVAMANVARMEAFLFAVVCGALLLLHRGHVWLAIAVLAFSPMIHPNGMFFLIPTLAYAWLGLGLRGAQPSRLALALLIAAALVWAANGMYALYYWEGFVHDAAHRVGETMNANKGLPQYAGAHLIALASIGIAWGVAAWRRAPVGHLLAFALGGWLTSRVRVEQWYEPFGDLMYLLLTLAILEIVARSVISPAQVSRPWLRTGAFGLVAVALFAVHYRQGRIEGPVGYFRDLAVFGMRVEEGIPYFTQADRQVLQGFLKSVAPERSIVVEVYPWSDGLLIDSGDPRVTFQVPFYDAVFYAPERWAWGYSPSIYPTPDVYLIRVSRYTPRYLKYRDEEVLSRALRRSGAERAEAIRKRDETEIWYAIRADGRSRLSRR